MVRLEVPGRIGYRNVVLRAVSAACKAGAREAGLDNRAAHELSVGVISAVGEAFNNVALHGYRGREPGIVRIELEMDGGGLRVRLEDYGSSFDPAGIGQPDLASLPESGMGVFILRSLMDDVSYVPGSPNTMTLWKRLDGGEVKPGLSRSAPPPR
jgi:serine/threonine-protein kinase RsbW